MVLDIHWQPARWLVAPGVLLAFPAAAIWVTALIAALGLMPAAIDFGLLTLPFATRRLVFLAMTLATPAASALCCALGVFGGDLHLADSEITARLRLPSSPSLAQWIGLLSLVAAVGLTLAMVGHLAADSLFGAD